MTSRRALTIRHAGTAHDFDIGRDVVVGRDPRADLRVNHPLVSRIHVVVRFADNRWWAIDSGSISGIYVGRQRVPRVEITDGLTVHLGNRIGPRLTFLLAEG